MKKILLLICCCIAFACGNKEKKSIQSKENFQIEKIQDNNVLLEILGKNKVVFVDFYADWCIPCSKLSPIIEEVSKEVVDVKFVKVNIDECQDLANSYNITNIPALLIFKNGKEVERLIGIQPKENIVVILNNQLQ